MFATTFLALAALSSFASAAPIEQRGAPANWAYGYLEDYETYHVRYLALKCFDKKNTDYFQDCCRPMLSTENLADNRKSYCIPSSDDAAYVQSSLAAKKAGPTASASASADKASESEYSIIQSSASSAAPSNAKVAAAATSSSVASTSSAAPAVQYIAPAQSSTSTTPAYTPPAPTTTSTTPAYTPPAPAPTTQAPSNNGGETMYGGFATYFYQGGNAGACGTVHSDSDLVIAIDQARWGSSSFGGGSSTCGKWITVTNTNNGRSVTAKVADVCPTCVNGNSLDLSQGAFRAIASDADGMVPISWRWA